MKNRLTTLINITFLFFSFLLFSSSIYAQDDCNWVGWADTRSVSGYDGYSNYLKHDNSGFVDVGGGENFVLTVKEDSTILAWGYNWSSFLDSMMTLQSVKKVVGGGEIVSSAMAAALLYDSTIVIAGDYHFEVLTGKYVDLDLGDQTGVAVKTDGTIELFGSGVLFPSSGTDTLVGIRQAVVSENGHYIIGIRQDSSFFLHGDDAFSFLYDNIINNMPAGLNDLAKVQPANDCVLALRADGTVVTWGSNCDALPDGLENIIDIASYGNHHIALKNDGSVIAWGSNDISELSNEWSDIVKIDIQSREAYGLKSDGSLVNWGVSSHWPLPMGLKNVKSILMLDFNAWNQNYAVTETGDVIKWGGFNIHGDNPTVIPNDLHPVKSLHLAPGDINAVIALEERGTVRAWNEDNDYELPEGLTNIVSIASNKSHGLALKGDGTVVTWGDNSYGQLDLPADLNDVKAMAVGDHHSLILKNDGTVLAFGSNTYGESTVPDGLTNVKRVVAGDKVSYAIKHDGVAVEWGAENGWASAADFVDVENLNSRLDGLIILRKNGEVEGFGYEYTFLNEAYIPEGLMGYTDIVTHGSPVVGGGVFVWRGLHASISSAFYDVTDQDTIPLTIQFTSAVSDFNLNDLVSTNGDVINLTTTDSITFNALFIVDEGINTRTTVSTYIKANSVTNADGFDNAESSPFEIDYWPNSNTVSGRVYEDVNQNCVYDSAIDIPLKDYVVQTGPDNYFALTKSDGTFEFLVGEGTHEVGVVIPQLQGKLISGTCQDSYAINPDSIGQVFDSLDFALNVTRCPVLSVDVTSNRRRRCFENITTITYRNSGFDASEPAQVYLRLPEYVELLSADSAYTVTEDSVYVFDVGSLAAGASGRIRIVDKVKCVHGITGLDQCTEAWITPVNVCLEDQTPPAVEWDGSELSVRGYCEQPINRSIFIIKNISEHDMSQTSTYRLYRNGQLAYSSNFQLGAGDSMFIYHAPFGGTLRLEADQSVGYPGANSIASTTVTGCASAVAYSVNSANFFQQPDLEPEVEIDCMPIIDSYDPNDKTVSPQGITEHRFVKPDSRLEYRVRFQNTGTDTAYTVVVVDTLSTLLDISTLEMGTTSHDYELEISGTGNPVLTWTFNNINLVDSLTDEPNSHGFLKYKISPIEELPDGSIVHNEADIYFDFNLPIRTNDAWMNLYDTVITTNEYTFGEDIVLPVATIEALPAYVNAPFTATIQITEDAIIALDDFTVENAIISNLEGSGQNYTILVTPNGEGEISLQMESNVFVDNAGNANVASNEVKTIYDSIQPTIIVSTSSNITHANAPFEVNIDMSEVCGITLDNINVSNGSVSNLQGGNTFYTVLVTPDNEGAVSVKMDEGVVTDVAGNGNEASTIVTVVYDVTAPTASLSTLANHVNGSFQVTIQLADENLITDASVLDLANFEVSNASLSDLQGSDDVYTVTVSPIAEGDVTISLKENSFNDLAYNNNTNSNELTVVYDVTDPTVSLATSVNQTNATFTVEATLSEEGDLSEDDFAVTNATVSDFQENNGVYTVLITPINEGDVTVKIDAGQFTDLAGNDNTVSNLLTVEYDITAPTITLSSTVSHTNATFTVEAILSEAGDLSEADFAVTNATVSNFQENNGVYSVLITAIGEGDVTVKIDADQFMDVAGNGNEASNELTVVYDITAPTATLMTTVSHTNAAFTVETTLSEIGDLSEDDFTATNATVSNFQETNGVYTVLITPISEGDVTVKVDADKFVDIAGNGNEVSNQLTIVYDIVAPTATLTSSVNIINQAFTIDVQLSDEATLSTDDFAVTNGSISSMAGSGTSYALQVMPVNDGEVNVQLMSDRFTDLAGNGNETSNQVSVTYDITPPTVIWEVTGEPLTTIGITFSETVEGELTLDDFEIVGTPAISLTQNGDGYLLEFEHVGGQADVSLKAGVVTDLAGNNNERETRAEIVTATVNEQLSKQTIVAPNPTTGKVRIDMPWASNATKHIQVIDVLGKVVKQQVTSAEQPQLNLEGMQRGTYIVRIISKGETVIKLIVKN